MLAAGSLLMAAALFLLAFAGDFAQAMFAAVLMSLGGAAVNAAANTLVSHLYGERRGPMLNVLGVFGAAGSVSVPLAFSGVTTYEQARTRLLVLATRVRDCRRSPPAPAAATAGRRSRPRATARPVGVQRSVDCRADSAAHPRLRQRSGHGGMDRAVHAGRRAPRVGNHDGRPVLGRARRRPHADAVRPGAHVKARAPRIRFVASPRRASLRSARQPRPSRSASPCCSPASPSRPWRRPTLSVAGDRYERNTGAVFGLLLSLAQFGGMIIPWLGGARGRTGRVPRRHPRVVRMRRYHGRPDLVAGA